jgi:hypothetical protein
MKFCAPGGLICPQQKDQFTEDLIVLMLCEKGPHISAPGTLSYSVLKLFTGFVMAAFIAWKLTVINAISNAVNPAIRNIHQLIFIL